MTIAALWSISLSLFCVSMDYIIIKAPGDPLSDTNEHIYQSLNARPVEFSSELQSYRQLGVSLRSNMTTKYAHMRMCPVLHLFFCRHTLCSDKSHIPKGRQAICHAIAYGAGES